MEEDRIVKLKELYEKLTDWEKANTTIPGIKIVKIPGKNDIPPRLAVELNPVDVTGKPIKKTGVVVLTNQDLYDKYMDLFNNPKVKELMQDIEDLRETLQPETLKHMGNVFKL